MKIKFGLLLAACAFITACNDDHSPLSALTTEVSGKVMDDPLSNAKVCFDENNNMSCDEDEMSTISGAGGQYHFEAIPNHLIANAPLLAEVSTDSINEHTGLPVETPYRLRSFAGCTDVITPLTSMVQHFVDLQYSPEAALKNVQRKVMTDLPICVDYTGEDESIEINDVLVGEYQHLHQMANIFNGFMNLNIKQRPLDSDVNSEINMNDFYSFVMHHQMNHLNVVIEELNTINDTTENNLANSPQVNNVDRKSAGNYFGTYLSQLNNSRELMIINSAARDMQDESALLNSMKNSRDTNLLSTLTYAESEVGGLYYYQDEYTTDKRDLSFVNQRIGRTVDQNDPRIGYNILYNYEQTAWNKETESLEKNHRFRSGLKVLMDTGFTNVLNSALLYGKNKSSQDWEYILFDYYYENNGPYENQARLIHSTGRGDFSTRRANNESYVLSSKSYNVSNRKLESLLSLEKGLSVWDQITLPNTRFSNNSKAHLVTTRAGTDFLLLNDSDRTCRPYEAVNNSCNYLSVFAPSSGTFYGIARDLKPVTFNKRNTATNLTPLIQNSNFNIPFLPIIFETEKDSVIAFLSSNNEVIFHKNSLENQNFTFRYTFTFSGSARLYNSLGRSTWERINFKGVDMLILNIPLSVRRLQPKVPSNIAIFLHNGVLKTGVFYKEGDIIEENRLAVSHDVHTQIIDALNKSKLKELELTRPDL